jgi:glycerol-3-phosphate dehydrogenase
LWQRLRARYGTEAPAVVAAAHPADLKTVGDTCACWAELRWAARAEAVVHLDDALLRRARLGLILPHGALPWLDRIRAIVQPEASWSDTRWETEVAAYARLWRQGYCVPGLPPAEAEVDAARQPHQS